MLTLPSALVYLSVSLLAAGSLSAESITIINPSFEATTGYNGGSPSTVPGFQDQGGTYGTVDDVTSLFTSGLSGTNAIRIGGGIQQLTSATFVTGETYTLSLDLGNPLTITDDRSGVTFGFRNAANNGYLSGGSLFADITTIPDGTFQNRSFDYIATAGDAGNPIRFGIEDFYNSTGSYRVDNVTLTTTAVPEASVYFYGVGAVALFAFACARNRRPA